jgi:spermidine/putrescine transport system substrate-binding protein
VLGGCAQPAGPTDGGAAGEEEKVLNLFAWSEYVPQALLDGFTEETGIQVNYDAFSSNEEMYAKISAGASGYDLIQPSDYWIGVMSRQGLLSEIDLTKIPNIVNADPGLPYDLMIRGYKYLSPITGFSGAMVNTEHITEPTIVTWTVGRSCGKIVFRRRASGRWRQKAPKQPTTRMS